MVAMPNLCIEGDMCSSAFLQKHLHIQSCRTRKYSGFRFECPFALEQKGARFSQSALLLIPWDGIWNGFFAAKGLSRDVHSNVTHPDKHGLNDLPCCELERRSSHHRGIFFEVPLIGSPARSRSLSITPLKAPSAALAAGGADQGFRQAKLAGMASGGVWATWKRCRSCRRPPRLCGVGRFISGDHQLERE